MLRSDRLPRCCPHCLKPLLPVRYGVAFGHIAASIIDHVARAGNHGISAGELFDAVYRDRDGATPARLRSYIGYINHQLLGSGVSIRIDRAQRYHLIITQARAS